MVDGGVQPKICSVSAFVSFCASGFIFHLRTFVQHHCLTSTDENSEHSSAWSVLEIKCKKSNRNQEGTRKRKAICETERERASLGRWIIQRSKGKTKQRATVKHWQFDPVRWLHQKYHRQALSLSRSLSEPETSVAAMFCSQLSVSLLKNSGTADNSVWLISMSLSLFISPARSLFSH